MTSKQKRRSPSLTGRTVQMRRSSSIIEKISWSVERFLEFESLSLHIHTLKADIYRSIQAYEYKQAPYKITNININVKHER